MPMREDSKPPLSRSASNTPPPTVPRPMMPRFTCCIGAHRLPRSRAGDNSILTSPTHRHSHLFSKPIAVMQLSVPLTILMNESRQLHVVTTILRDFREFAIFEPADSLQTFGGFFHTERSRRNRVERKPVVQRVLQFHH